MPIEVLPHHFKEDIKKLSMDHMIPLESIQEILEVRTAGVRIREADAKNKKSPLK